MFYFRPAATIFIALGLVMSGAAAFASIGTVVEVQQGATLTASGPTSKIKAGMEIESGDVIKTDGKGVVQLIFHDETKIAVGPNARMIVDASMMRGNKRARNFAVKALGGSFRFISGNSESSVYTIETPSATMGIRGTAFDFWVSSGEETAITMLSGQVNMCDLEGDCLVISGQCSLALTDRGGKISIPSDKERTNSVILRGFPFIRSQELLLDPFRTESGSCGLASVITDAVRKAKVELPALPGPIPEPPADPPPDDPPASEPPSTGFPGNSGDEGPSASRGNDVSDGQNGTGTGSGQGAANRSDKSNRRGIGENGNKVDGKSKQK